jgi:Polysaccharide pyruvyl transferase
LATSDSSKDHGHSGSIQEYLLDHVDRALILEKLMKPGQPKFGLLQYPDTDNIGDEMQSLAVRQFLPRVDSYIDREAMNGFVSTDGPAWTVLNGWFCHKPENWPPSEHITPLILSFHLSPAPSPWGATGAPATEIILGEPSVRYLRGFGPVGARDLPTLDLLKKAGIDSYFSGCMTLTLRRPAVERDDNLVVLCDVPQSVNDHVRRVTDKRVEIVSHGGLKTSDHHRRFSRAEQLLNVYARASCVVTSRHGSLPCVAMGTPAFLLDTAPDRERFAGLEEFVRHGTTESLISGSAAFDVNQPPPNLDQHLAVRQDLCKRVSSFVAAALDGQRPPAYPLSPAERYQVLSMTLSKITGNMLIRQQSLAERVRETEQRLSMQKWVS